MHNYLIGIITGFLFGMLFYQHERTKRKIRDVRIQFLNETVKSWKEYAQSMQDMIIEACNPEEKEEQ